MLALFMFTRNIDFRSVSLPGAITAYAALKLSAISTCCCSLIEYEL